MPKSCNNSGASAITEEPTKVKLNKGDAERLGAAPLKPSKARAARKPSIGVPVPAGALCSSWLEVVCFKTMAWQSF